MNRVLYGLRVRTWLAGLALISAAGMVGAGTLAKDANKAGSAQSPAATQGTNYAKTLSVAFRHAAEQVLPSVVMITSTPAVAERSKDDSLSLGKDLENTPFGDLLSNPQFRRFFKDVPMPHNMPDFHARGVGSGVIIDPSGVILTNNHVVEGGGMITVRLRDGREFKVTEVHGDPRSDLAIVRIQGAGTLPAAKLGNSDTTEVGDWVLALGEPFGLEGTVTAGIISAKGRGLGITARESFLQTDAAINPGNSGGPLVTLDGEVVGINTAISSRTGANSGVGFAIPVNLAKWVADQLVAHGKVSRAYMGVVIQPVTQKLADQLGVKVNEGVLVADVQKDTPAAKAGIKAGDVIVAFDGKSVSNPMELQGLVEQAKIGGHDELTVIRDGKRMTMPVNVGEMPKSTENR